ncbi:MAG: hypothetical protein OEY91_06530 [Nitrospirota bacterium]|nr:hypothetical protein [Nitrospirota bacterium]
MLELGEGEDVPVPDELDELDELGELVEESLLLPLLLLLLLDELSVLDLLSEVPLLSDAVVSLLTSVFSPLFSDFAPGSLSLSE